MIAKQEARAISAVVKNQDIHIMLESNVEPMLTYTGDVWEWIKDYYEDSRSMPSGYLLEEHFAHFDFYDDVNSTQYEIDRLREKFVDENLKNALKAAASNLKEGQRYDALSILEESTSALSALRSGVRDIDVTDGDSAADYIVKVQEMNRAGVHGIRTGIASFDACLPMGIAEGQLGVMLAYPAIGKSWLALKIAVEAWRSGRKPMILSLEMTEEEVRNRIIAIISEGKYPHRSLVKGNVDVEEFREWAKDVFRNTPQFKIVSGDRGDPVNPNLIRAKIDQYKPDIVLIDYLQLMTDNTGTSSNETVKIKNLSRELKLLATSMRVPIVAIASATPDDATDLSSVPQLGQVAWSRQIAYDADWLLALGRDQDSDILECTYRKNRNGMLGDFLLNVDFNLGKFEETYDDEI